MPMAVLISLKENRTLEIIVICQMILQVKEGTDTTNMKALHASIVTSQN